MPTPITDTDGMIVTWPDVHRDAKYLVRKLLSGQNWKGIVALTRGGLVPAAIVAREMDMRLIDTLCISTYEEQEIGTQATILKAPETAAAEQGEGWLLIDDLVDTGTTLKAARDLLPKAHFATLYAKPEGQPLVDTFLHEVPQDQWVFFPWDTDLQYVVPLARG
ncbi:xanthine phosphoribosyltransferase [Magnetospira sp. QH-2]|uniref:xanthine phosphoribosyltransferase n=1 Tax=Magnetospira sp. (strain QH-2) TaxID=1288970 RepID=UPI0003E80EA7|nr:xanthine phosphoribosyltransferase [Magnetospira sp. QH-2]CCQ75256.1 xanthine phosphoribosyltransferase [Magnetospira sp. QH-2]